MSLSPRHWAQPLRSPTALKGLTHRDLLLHQPFDPIDAPGEEISWKLLHDEVYEKSEKLPANMEKASKLPYKTMHP